MSKPRISKDAKLIIEARDRFGQGRISSLAGIMTYTHLPRARAIKALERLLAVHMVMFEFDYSIVEWRGERISYTYVERIGV